MRLAVEYDFPPSRLPWTNAARERALAALGRLTRSATEPHMGVIQRRLCRDISDERAQPAEERLMNRSARSAVRALCYGTRKNMTAVAHGIDARSLTRERDLSLFVSHVRGSNIPNGYAVWHRAVERVTAHKMEDRTNIYIR